MRSEPKDRRGRQALGTAMSPSTNPDCGRTVLTLSKWSRYRLDFDTGRFPVLPLAIIKSKLPWSAEVELVLSVQSRVARDPLCLSIHAVYLRGDN
jgi:hypothetical protein